MMSRLGSATEQNNHVLSTPLTGLQRRASYILNQVFQIVVNVLVFQALLGRERPGNDREAERGSVFHRKITMERL